MPTVAHNVELFLEHLFVAVVDKATRSDDPLDVARFEAKLEAQRVLVEHGGDLTLAAKAFAAQKLQG